MGSLPRLKLKTQYNYRKGSTNESNNCKYCLSFIRDKGRCMIIGLGEGRRYNIREDYTCDTQKFNGTDFSKDKYNVA